MKITIKRLPTLLCALALIFCLPFSVYAADSTVRFQDGELIAFGPGSTYTDSDLFDGFKGVMPGDVRTEEITIQNSADAYDSIKVYLRAVPHDAENNPISEEVLAEIRTDGRRDSASSESAYMADFLSQLSMEVENGGAVIYAASPDQPDGLIENVYLGELRKGETVQLDVTLTVPLTLGNDYMDRIGEVDWVFAVEGCMDPANPPDTGDPANLGLALSAVLLFTGGMTACLILYRRSRKKS